ncbi:MAG: transcription antitermination factor NusB [Ruminococcus sp.]|nr:transcription antitermination factor NusB [Ruminococcus sp.]
MPAKRRDVRESTLILTFEKLFRDDSLEEIFETASEAEGVIINSEVKALVSGIIEKSDEIDRIISKYSDKRAVERIPKINLAVLRLAIYEALYDEKVPVNVAISEAVFLAGKYALDPDVSFVNGVLGSYFRSEGAPQNNE